MTETPQESGAPQEQEEEKEAVDPALLEAAVELLRQVVRGNGIKPEDVQYHSFEGEVLHFEIFEHFAIEPKVFEKLLHGKENGHAVGSRQEARNKVQTAIGKAARDPDVRHATVEILKQRPDRGFGLDDQYIPFDRLRQTFVAHELCSVCGGSMRMVCQSCQGNGRLRCTKCHGSKEMICPRCHGRRHDNTPQGQKPCPRCRGRGKAKCDLCSAAGALPCRPCKSSGQVACKNCSGTGWLSQVLSLEMRARSRFYYEAEKLPPELPPLLDSLRGAMVTEGHCEAVINEEIERAKELDNASKDEEYLIPYNVRLPWGDIKFLLQEQELPAKLFGFQPSLIHAPPFLETAAAPGLRALNEAALTGNAAAKIAEAVRFRAVAEAILAAAQMRPRRALDSMHKKYPFGFRPETLKDMLQKGDRALKRATKGPRFIGLALGLAGTAALYAAYYVGPLRALLSPLAGGNNAAMNAADVLLALAGGAGTTLSIQLTAAGALRRAVGRLLPPEKRKKLLPKAGQSALWGYAGGLAIYFAMIEAAALRGGDIPAWYAHIMKLAGF